LQKFLSFSPGAEGFWRGLKDDLSHRAYVIFWIYDQLHLGAERRMDPIRLTEKVKKAG
jgi:hypothetical protein